MPFRSLCAVTFLILLAGCARTPTIKMTPYQSQILTDVPQNPEISVGLVPAATRLAVSPSQALRIVDEQTGEQIVTSSAETWIFEHVLPAGAQGAREVWQLQLAAYQTPETAESGVDQVRQILPVGTPVHIVPDGKWYKIRVGEFDTRQAVIALKADIDQHGQFTDSFPIPITLPATDQGHIRLRNQEGESLGFLWEGPLTIQAVSGHLTHEDRSYRGELIVGVNQLGTMYLANRVTVTAYLQGVLPAEMHPSWASEALKAQAVVARTYLINQLEAHLKEGFNVCNSTHCQVYQGLMGETERSNQAVLDTQGEILVFANQPIKAVYSSCCGGYSERIENVWDTPTAYDYLKSQFDSDRRQFHPYREPHWQRWIKSTPDVFCRNSITAKNNSVFRWEVTKTQAELTASVKPYANVGTVTRIVPQERGQSGRLMRITVEGTAGQAEIAPELNIRRALGGLRSSAFVVKKRGDQFIFRGAGYGHGVGMCQVGAVGMAERGYNYREILGHYYHHCHLYSIYQANIYTRLQWLDQQLCPRRS